MGHFSSICKHCNRPIQDTNSTWKGLNEWMSSAVVLTEDGSRLIGEYDGYGRVGGNDTVDSGANGAGVWVHKACWAQAGKPEFEDYDGPSAGTQHSGYDEADLLPEPGTDVDQAAWDEALAARKATIRATFVRQTLEIARSGKPYSSFHFNGEYQVPGEEPKPDGWVVYNNLCHPEGNPEPGVYGLESQEAANALIEQKTAEFLASDELAAMKAEYQASLVAKAEARKVVLTASGEPRFVVTEYGPTDGWSVYDNCDPQAYDELMSVGEGGDEADTYILLGGTEEEAKSLAAEKEAAWRV